MTAPDAWYANDNVAEVLAPLGPEPACAETSPDEIAFVCTQTLGHEGRHVASDGYHACAAWPGTDPPDPPGPLVVPGVDVLRAFVQREKDKALDSYEATTGNAQHVHAGAVSAFEQVLWELDRMERGDQE